MDKDIVKEIFLLTFEIFKALCEIVWKKIKGLVALMWDRFFGLADASREEPAQQEWGVTGEDEWPIAPEAPPVKQEEPQQRVETKEIEIVYTPKTPELPDAYGDNRIVLMVRDPEWLFTYWELRQDVIDSARNTLIPLAEGAKTILRVYDVTDIIFNGYNAHKYFDIEVAGGVRSWYIHAGEPNRSFCVDIGFLAPDGTFRVLSRSNIVRTPRMGVSGVVDEEWMSIEELYEKAYVPMGRGISESVFERARTNWQETLKEGVSSPESSGGLKSLF
ncbi:MAG TPA: DUF4912 domain-containing protein [Syntrophales bacterium]|nr:DUF4912 domain-containing protein [Candidatus Brocadiaceae bacterium]HLE17429.1 DUF4912 domain-containing protein [Syntrophales bacterium]